MSVEIHKSTRQSHIRPRFYNKPKPKTPQQKFARPPRIITQAETLSGDEGNKLLLDQLRQTATLAGR